MRVLWDAAALILVTAAGAAAQNQRDPDALLKEAERLSWLKAWTAAAPLYIEAEHSSPLEATHVTPFRSHQPFWSGFAPGGEIEIMARS